VGPTLRDVAAEARVSTMTVSNVVNGQTGRASPATVARVLAAVEKLGYVPSAPARALSTQSTRLVTLIYPAAPQGVASLVNAHDSIFVSEVERWVSADKRHLLIHAARDPISAATEVLRTWRVDGAIFLGTFSEEIEGLPERHDAPMVFVDNYSPSPDVNVVRVDDRRGGYLAGKALVAAGHRAVGFVGPPRDHDGVIRRRHQGFLAGLEGHGAALAAEHEVQCDSTFEDGLAAAVRLAALPHRPTGVFATADVLAAGLVKGFSSAGVTVPEQVSVVGFDDLPVARQVTPELTTVRQDVEAKARASVELLKRLIDGWPDGPAEQVELEVALVERRTVAPPPRR
jgi:LacI family transcriptional regulator